MLGLYVREVDGVRAVRGEERVRAEGRGDARGVQRGGRPPTLARGPAQVPRPEEGLELRERQAAALQQLGEPDDGASAGVHVGPEGGD